MARFKVAPTKTNLLRLRGELEFVEEGYQLLEQKREILVAELLTLIDKVKDAQRQVEGGLKEAFYALEQAITRMGRGAVGQAALAVNIQSTVSISHRGVMGVEIPVVETTYRDTPPYYSLTGTSFWLDESIEKFRNVLKLMGRLVQVRLSLLRLAREVKRTVRRVNALEKISLPDYRETLNYIQDVLEEQERETFFILKLVKSRLERSKERS